MATFDWPAAWRPKQFDLGLFKATVQSRSPTTQAFHAVDLLAWRWMVSLDMGDELTADAGPYEAFFNRLSGGVHDVRLWHFNRPVPMGTMRGTPTLASVAAQFTDLLSVQTVPGATLLDGDFFGLANQLLQVAEPAAADASGLMSVRLVNRLRAAVATSTALVWDKPTARFVVPASQARFGHVGGRMLGAGFELEEVY